jgi:hypothetical protein
MRAFGPAVNSTLTARCARAPQVSLGQRPSLGSTTGTVIAWNDGH